MAMRQSSQQRPLSRAFRCLFLSLASGLVACGTSDGSQTALPIAIAITPNGATVLAGETLEVTAVVSNDPANRGVSWSVSCPANPCGTVSPATTASGMATVYTAPSTQATSDLAVALIATSMSDAGATARTTLTVPVQRVAPEVFTTSTRQEGSLLILQNQTSTDTIRIGLNTAWGGSIVEVSLNGTNYVNEADPGREVQPAFYDGNAQYGNCCGSGPVNWGWNPVLAGDRYGHGTPTLAQVVSSDSLYTRAQPLLWNPDIAGGGLSEPIAGDMLVEQTVTPVSGYSHAFQVHYRITHLGSDSHATAGQEFPAVYVNVDYDRFVYYGGPDPWTNGAVSVTEFQRLGDPAAEFMKFYVPEHWGAHVNGQNVGLTVYVPAQYPYVYGFDNPGPSGPTGDGTNYFAPLFIMTIKPNFVFEGDIYVIAGDYRTARQIVYELNRRVSTPDISSPFGATDTPSAGSTIGGITPVAGWTFDNFEVASVEILVDRIVDGTASYGGSRPDVANDYPNAPTDVVFSYSLNTTKYVNGPHVLNVQVTDTNGNVAVFSDVAVVVSN